MTQNTEQPIRCLAVWFSPFSLPLSLSSRPPPLFSTLPSPLLSWLDVRTSVKADLSEGAKLSFFSLRTPFSGAWHCSHWSPSVQKQKGGKLGGLGGLHINATVPYTDGVSWGELSVTLHNEEKRVESHSLVPQLSQLRCLLSQYGQTFNCLPFKAC